MSRAYYDEMKQLAREKRVLYKVDTAEFGLLEVRKIYKAEDIKIDYFPMSYKIKAVYMCGDDDCSVALQRTLPYEPKLFALVHELKHHYLDREALGQGAIHCGDYNINDPIEIGAEVFAAEFIYPEAEFALDLAALGITNWTPAEVVNLKRNCKAKVSYRYLCKRLQHLGLIRKGAFDNVKFQNLEDQLFGVPFHRQRRATTAIGSRQ